MNPSTVVAAHDLLLAQGLVLAQRNRGFLVRDRAPLRTNPAHTGAPAAASGADTTLRMAAPVNAVALIRGMFHPAGSRPQPGMGAFPPDWMASTFMQAAVRRVTTPQALADSSLRYGEPLGDGHLRRVLADRLQGMGLPVEPQHIITTVGATHALDIVSRTLLKPGDCVMVEEPG